MSTDTDSSISTSLPKKMDDILSCPVGYEMYDEKEHRPYTISSCGHTFCLKCLKKLPKKRCPECRRDFKKINPNFALIQVIRHRNEKKKDNRTSDFFNKDKFRSFNRQYLLGPIKRKMVSIRRNINPNSMHRHQSENNLNTSNNQRHVNPSTSLAPFYRSSVDVLLVDESRNGENQIVSLNHDDIKIDNQKLFQFKMIDKEIIKKSKFFTTVSNEIGKLKCKLRST